MCVKKCLQGHKDIDSDVDCNSEKLSTIYMLSIRKWLYNFDVSVPENTTQPSKRMLLTFRNLRNNSLIYKANMCHM